MKRESKRPSAPRDGKRYPTCRDIEVQRLVAKLNLVTDFKTFAVGKLTQLQDSAKGATGALAKLHSAHDGGCREVIAWLDAVIVRVQTEYKQVSGGVR